MKLRILGAAFAAAGLLASASHASAAGFILTFEGTVSQGWDDTNIFGLGFGHSLAGQSVSQTFVVDYAGGGNHDIAGDSYFRDSIGGVGFISSSLTINGVSVSVGSETGIDDRTDQHLNPNCNGPNCKSSFSVFTGDESFLNAGGFLETWGRNGGNFGVGVDYHPSLALAAPVFTDADNLNLFGSFTIYHTLFDQTKGLAVFDDETTGMFTADKVTITEFRGGVPEPATWGLMLLGFGAMGAVLRRRRAATILA